MVRKVRFRASAEADLFALYEYIAEVAGRQVAGNYIERIEAACMQLETFPERGTKRDDLAPGLRTVGFERRVTLAFRVLPDAVEIVAIAYAGRDFTAETSGSQ
ncbi:type II toxin-antitoxin system RelE/ParE family toxin [Rhodovulum sp. PH10]|uniref:type II toxin-antitoxin system RelE/ParE family toxin n=1 Tax=Rhodovulum sp. PH10 TaxID=1187851 RepID=UPI00058D7773|nr:type II toxin-antitoxin system RelE/ParE family toxin [Rhodovulum sp. PH10]